MQERFWKFNYLPNSYYNFSKKSTEGILVSIMGRLKILQGSMAL